MKVKRKIRILLLASFIIISANSVSNTIEVPERKESDSSLTALDTKANNVIVEHRINGRIDSIEIKPIIGQPYYLLDNDDRLRKGTSQSRGRNEILSNWRLLQW